VRLWLLASGVLTLLLMASNWANFQSATLIASLLVPYLVFPWFLVVIVLGVAPVTGARAEALADGILSRPVARHEYLLAAWAARVVTVLSVYLVVIVPAVLLIAFAERPVREDTLTVYGVVGALGVVAVVQTFLVSLGFLLGTLFRSSFLALVVLLFVWFPASLILTTFKLAEFSPIALNQALPTLLRQSWSPDEKQAAANDADLEALSEQFLSVLSGKSQRPPARSPDFFDREGYENVSLLWVLLGYGLPTLLTVGLATLSFSRRDL